MTTERDEQTPDPLHWNDQYLLGYTPIDEVHEEFVGLVGKMQAASDAELAALLAEFTRHCEQHFEMENRWMVETSFPPRDCHIDEHAAVLKSVREVQALLAQGHTGPCRRLAQELAQWFPGHADYLDSALAHWMCKQRLGGKPVVIRRDLNLRSAPPDAKN